jgi:hypothetical protein
MNTLLLNPSTWDLMLDANGNIAIASNPYSLAQDVASSCRTYFGEVYYDTTDGVQYQQQILGELPPLSLLKSQYMAAALRVPEVEAPIKVIFTSFNGRTLGGGVLFTDENGNAQGVSF